MNKKILIILLIFITNFSFSQEKFNKDRLETSKKLVKLIEKKDYKKILKLFPDEIAKKIPEKALKYYVDMGSNFISEYGIPKDKDLITKVNIVPTKTETVMVNSIIFPFPATKEKYTMPKRIIEVGFIEKFGNKKIISFNVAEFQPPPAPKEIKYLDKLEFGTDSISNWRIYYSKGNIKNENREVFAVSGDLNKMKKLKIEKTFNEFFKELTNASIKEKLYPNDIVRFKGNPENISISWQYEGNNKFYRISMILNKENNIDEPLNDYVIVSTSIFANQPTVYYVEKKNVMKLVESLKEFSKRDWKENFEKNP